MIYRYSERLLVSWASRVPRLAIAAQRFYRLVQPRFTIGVVGVLLDDQKRVLIVKHVFHPHIPWGLPGGWIGNNELPQRAVEREFLEETQLRVKASMPLYVWGSPIWKNHIDMGFIVLAEEALPDTLQLCNELSDYQWATFENLPRLSPIHKHIIRLALWSIDNVRQTQ